MILFALTKLGINYSGVIFFSLNWDFIFKEQSLSLTNKYQNPSEKQKKNIKLLKKAKKILKKQTI